MCIADLELDMDSQRYHIYWALWCRCLCDATAMPQNVSWLISVLKECFCDGNEKIHTMKIIDLFTVDEAKQLLYNVNWLIP